MTDVFYKGKRLNEDAPIRVRPCSRTLKHTVHLDKVKPERFLLPISKKKTHVIEIHAGQITTTDLTISLPHTLNFEPFGGYSKIAAVERHHKSVHTNPIFFYSYMMLLSVTGSVPLGYSFCSAYDKITGPFAVILQIPLGVIRSSGITGSARNESVTNGSI